MQKESFLCLFQLVLVSDALVPTFLTVSYSFEANANRKNSTLLFMYKAFSFGGEELGFKVAKGQWTEILDCKYIEEQIILEMKVVLATEQGNKPCDMTIFSE